jgi:hypothetical protein
MISHIWAKEQKNTVVCANNNYKMQFVNLDLIHMEPRTLGFEKDKVKKRRAKGGDAKVRLMHKFYIIH